MLSGKSGVTHFHVGSGGRKLALLRALLDDFETKPELLYPTHVERNEKLMEEAIDLSRRGVTVDVDTVEQDLLKWVRFYWEHGGDSARLTASSDAAINSPGTLFEQVRECVLQGGFALEVLLPMVTANTARVLKLRAKGQLMEGVDADVLVLRRPYLDIEHVIAGGRHLIKNGQLNFNESFLKSSNRKVVLYGEK